MGHSQVVAVEMVGSVWLVNWLMDGGAGIKNAEESRRTWLLQMNVWAWVSVISVWEGREEQIWKYGRGDRLQLRFGLETVGEVKLVLNPIRIDGWAWKLNWHKTRVTGKQHTNFTCTWKSPQENEEPTNHQHLNAFILGWTERGNYGKVTKIYRGRGRELKEDKSYFNKVCACRILSALTSCLWW